MIPVYRTTPLFLLLAVGWLSPQVLLSQPQAVFPRLKGIGLSDVPGDRTDFQVVTNIAYLTLAGGTNDPGGLEIFSLTNPSVPVRINRYESQLPSNAVEVAGRYAYLALGARKLITNDLGALEIVDVGNPAHPVRVSHTDTFARANDIRVAGNYAYVAGGTRWTGSNLLGALEIFDVSIPTNPVRVAAFNTLGSVTSIDVSANYAFLTDGVTDVQVLNVSDPGHPWRTGIYQPDLAHCAYEPSGHADYVQLVGHLLYSAGGNGLNVLDISDPSQPVRVLDNSCIPIHSFHVTGPYACMALYHSSLNTFVLHIADITNPTNWVPVGMKGDWQPARMQIVGNLIYLATNPLLVYELSEQPTIQSISNRDGYLTLVWDYSPGFVLQRSASLVNPVWTVVPTSVGQNTIELPATGENEFFRLARK